MSFKSASKVTLFALTTFACCVPAAAQLTKVTVGYSGISADQLVIWVAKDTGIFAKNNLDAQPIYFTGGTMSVTACGNYGLG